MKNLLRERFARKPHHRDGVLPLKNWCSPAERHAAATRRIVAAVRRR
jgi:hypothetical protein